MLCKYGVGAIKSFLFMDGETNKNRGKRSAERGEEMTDPTGATMVLRTEKVKDRVEQIYLTYPSTRGDDRLLIKRYLDIYCPQVRLTAKQFALLRTIPSFETIRRRGQELRHDKPELQPTEKTKHKRMVRETAYRHYYGKGLTLMDFDTE